MIGPIHRQILEYLAGNDGFVAADIGGKVWPDSPRRNASANVILYLRDLEHQGLVKRMDEKKPIVWMRTPAGDDALRECKPGRGS